jgi:hypothetical protein
MAALPLPPAVEDKMDARHRAFIWTGSSQASGAQCLVAWAKASLSKENGGLGIKRLDCQNACLLLKLLHRLHHPEGSAWAIWAREQINMATLEGDTDDCHWKALCSVLLAYRRIMHIAVGDGRLLTVKFRQPSHEFTFGVGMSFISYPLVLTPLV